jgi:hypothetical protein
MKRFLSLLFLPLLLLVGCSTENAQQYIDAGCLLLSPENRSDDDYEEAIAEFRKAVNIDSGYLELLTATQNLYYVSVSRRYLPGTQEDVITVKSICDVYIIPVRVG